MGDLGSHPGRKQEKRQGKEVLGFAHPIQVNLFEEFHAHSDPLELDTNDHRFVPKIKLFPALCSTATLGCAPLCAVKAGSQSVGDCKTRTGKSACATKCSVPPHEASWPSAR